MDFITLRNYTRARTKTQQNNAVTEEDLGMFLNMSLADMYNIIATDYEDYNVIKYLSAISQNNQIPLPPDFFKLRAVDFGTLGFWTTVYGFMLEERNRMNNPIVYSISPYGNLAARRVRVMNNKIFVEPELLAAGQYQIWYTPKYQNLVLDTDTLPPAMDTNGWVEYAVASTGEKIYDSLNLPTDSFVRQQAHYESVIRNGAANVMSNGPQCMTNVRNTNDWSPIGGNMGGWGI